MSSPAPPIAPAMASPTPPVAECPTQSSLLALADVNLEEIFLRLPTPAALARASLACAAFRRIITERSFLRRFRKRHPPPLLGIINDEGVFVPTEAPHPSAPLSRALVQGADFTYSFVPKPIDDSRTTWSPCDVRDGRVLLEHRRPFGADTFFTDLAVCDPLSRRYVLLPPIPEDMAIEQERLDELRHILIPIGEDEDETSLKVICLAYYRSKLVTFIFSSVTRQWCIAAATSWSSLGIVDPFRKLLSCFNYLRGCFYWSLHWEYKLLVLDTHRMEFSTLSIHPGYYMQFIGQPEHIRCMPTVVEGTKGALEVFNLVGDRFVPTRFDLIGGRYDLTPFYIYHTFQQKGESSSEWLL